MESQVPQSLRPEDRVAIFIDGSNFYHGIRQNLKEGTNVKFSELIPVLLKGRRLVRTYYYNAFMDPNEDSSIFEKQERFFQSLRKLPYFQVILCQLQSRFKDGQRRYLEKGVDVRIAVDMVRLASRDHFDVAVLVSGDGDFRFAVSAIKELGRAVEVAYFKRGLSKELANVADFVEVLDIKSLGDAAASFV